MGLAQRRREGARNRLRQPCRGLLCQNNAWQRDMFAVTRCCDTDSHMSYVHVERGFTLLGNRNVALMSMQLRLITDDVRRVKLSTGRQSWVATLPDTGLGVSERLGTHGDMTPEWATDFMAAMRITKYLGSEYGLHTFSM